MSSHTNFKNKKESLLAPKDHDRRTGIVFFSFSMFLHVLVFGGLVFFQDFKRPTPLPPVIQIDLVSFSPELAIDEPAASETESKPEGIPVKTQVIKKKNRKIPTIKADISLKTKPKNLKDLMAQKKKKKKAPEKKKPVEKKKPEKEVDPDKALKEAKEQLAKKVEEQNQDKIAEVLSRLQKKVKEQGKTKEGGGDEVSAGFGKKGAAPIRLYQELMKYAFQQNWAFNQTLARMDQDLEVRILIKILKSGEIRDIIYETKSGNRYLDESAKKAIKKASPLPQLPAGMYDYDLVIGFTPKGLI